MDDLRVFIVDDEKRVRTSIINILKLHCSHVEVIGEAENVEDAMRGIKNLKPEIVLLDIKIHGGTGFDLLKQITDIKFKVIFITAFNEFAIQAFKFSAIDYLLKPVIPDELVLAIDRARYSSFSDSAAKLSSLKDHFYEQQASPKKIVLNTQESLHIVDINEIIQCEADSNYTRFHLADKKQLFISKPLKEYDELLGRNGFFRCHHSHLVNLNQVQRFDKKDGGYLIMRDGSRVLVSSRRTGELINALSKLGSSL